MTDTPLLFSPFNIGGCRLKNRIAALPVFTGYAHPDGRVSTMLIDHYSRLADSGAALVVVANAAVSENGVVSRYNLRADKDEYIPGLTRLGQAIRQNGAAACLQLNHGGRFAKTDHPLHPSPIDSSHFSFNISSLKQFLHLLPLENRFGMIRYFFNKINTWRRTMQPGEYDRVIADFRDAALRACRAGFDMIELHGANGYLLCQFMSAFSNRLTGNFGGDFKGRIQFPLAVIREVRKVLPKGFPVGFRLLLREWVPDGIDLTEALAFAKVLEKEKIAYLSASVGSYHSIFSERVSKIMARPAYLKKEMAGLTAGTTVPTIISGRIITPKLAESLLRENVADLIGLGRPLRVDPEWVAKARSGSQKITACINCNGCLRRVIMDQGFVCGRWQQADQERTELEHKLLTRNNRQFWMITDRNDVKSFRRVFPFYMPDGGTGSSRYPPTFFFQKQDEKDGHPITASADYIQWSSEIRSRNGNDGGAASPIIRENRESFDISRENIPELETHGMIFIGQNLQQAWRKRLIYQLRGKVIALVGSHPNPDRVIAAVDLSSTTSLMMIYLKQNYLKKSGLNIRFVHVLNGPAAAARHRWMTIKKVAGIDESLSLKLLASGEDVAAVLAEVIREGEYGTVIMGKRGISGIKRWLLGSVSKGVLDCLTDQTLFLID